MLAVNLVFVLLFYKELKLATFDRELAAALGFAPAALHYLLMSLVSITVVGAFESVGAILVVAMLIVPPATAYLLTDRLSRMLLLSALLGVAAAVGGYGMARWLDASIAGSMATVAGALFLLAFLLSPRHGLAAQALRHRRLSLATAEQLVMLHLSHGEGVPEAEVVRRFAWPARRLEATVRRLAERGWIETNGSGLKLTAAGAMALEASGQAVLRHGA